MQEIWKDISGYEGIYKVSNTGFVKRNGKVLKSIPNKNGYMVVHLYRNGKSKTYAVHRLVAEAFCFKPNGCNVVNHLDSDRSNNSACNLEFTTARGNMQHAAKQGRMKSKENIAKASMANIRPVVAECGAQTLIYPSAKAAEVDGFRHEAISRCCKGRRKTHKGYKWRYASIDGVTK